MKLSPTSFILPLSFHVRDVVAIVGGAAAKPGQFPQVVSIHQSGEYKCGGVILTQSTIITAASCVDGMASSPSIYEVFAGSLSKNDGEQKVGVKTVIEHPTFNRETHKGDIALLVLTSKLELRRFVKEAATNVQSDYSGQVVKSPGWGNSDTNPPSKTLLYNDLLVKDTETCKGDLATFDENSMLCASSSKDSGFCDGDEGSPLLADSLYGDFAVIGVASQYPKPCGEYASYYTKVSYYQPWIMNNMVQY